MDAGAWGVVAAWFAALVSAFGAGIVLWVRHRDRARPSWVSFRGEAWPDQDTYTTRDVWVTLLNTGNGAAYRVIPSVDSGFVQIEGAMEFVAPQVSPGGEVRLRAWDCAPGAVIRVEWLAVPVRPWKVSFVEVPVDELLNQPIDVPGTVRPLTIHERKDVSARRARR